MAINPVWHLEITKKNEVKQKILTVTWAWVSEFLMLALRLRHAECMLRDARVMSDRRWDMSRSVAVFISPNWRRNETTARHRDRSRLCSAEKYSLKDWNIKVASTDILIKYRYHIIGISVFRSYPLLTTRKVLKPVYYYFVLQKEFSNIYPVLN